MRTNGILMPVFSLPSAYGIGDMGPEAYRFVDFLDKAGQSFWQILPLNPTNYGDSPYQSFSTFAGNPYFVSPDLLIEDGLLTEGEVRSFDFGHDPEHVNYGKLYNNRLPMLKIAFSRFKGGEDYERFVTENNEWLDGYALFMTIKNLHQDKGWTDWEDDYRFRKPEAIERVRCEHADLIDLYKFIQYEFDLQWKALKAYANERMIRIIGDVPIYVAYDSADVWANPGQFYLDDDLQPVKVAGCPPDAFSEDGQLWGNPLYLWDKMAEGEEPFHWWRKRVARALELYDVIRIDHFRGFEAYYTIPYGNKTAAGGKWVKGPGMSLFKAIQADYPGENLPIIAEDLGFLTPEVKQLLKDSGFPGMKVLQFAFDSREESDYLPHNFTRNCVAYTGTHDNDTIIGWTQTAAKADVEFAKKYLHANQDEGFNWTMMRAAMMSVADTCVLMMQDFMGLSSDARINEPATVGSNWQWRIDGGCINDWLAEIIHDNTKMYGRIPKAKLEAEKKAEEAAKAKEKAEAENETAESADTEE